MTKLYYNDIIILVKYCQLTKLSTEIKMNQSSAPISISMYKLIKFSIFGAIAAMLMFLLALSVPMLVPATPIAAGVVKDITPPTINGASDMKIYVGNELREECFVFLALRIGLPTEDAAKLAVLLRYELRSVL